MVGVNDLHNPRVTAGEHATAFLISRSYVDGQGATWDGPGIIAPEAYGHWYVDDEIVTAAKQRGVWVFAPRARVEHMNPAWDLGEADKTHEHGLSKADADRATFEARLAKYGNPAG